MARRLTKKGTTEKFRCRKCGILKLPTEYYKAVDLELDSNGQLSVCKKCCSELFEKEMVNNNEIIEKALLSLCRRMNIAYDRNSVEKTRLKMEELKKDDKPLDILFGVYLQAVHNGKTNESSLMFSEPVEVKITNVSDDKINEWSKRWGNGFPKEDYEFLEEEYSAWSEDRKTLTAPDITLLEEICHLKLQIKRTRNPNNPADDLVKQLQGLVKSANEQLKVNKDQEDDGLETISSIIKIMESSYPAEFYKDKSLYADYDYDMTDYYNKHVTRAIKNFASGTRDFDFDMESEKDDDEIEVDASLPQKEDD